MSNDAKILTCVSIIEQKCEELSKLTDAKDRVEREYSMLAQRILNSLEVLRKKQSEREEKRREKEDKMLEKTLKMHKNQEVLFKNQEVLSKKKPKSILK